MHKFLVLLCLLTVTLLCQLADASYHVLIADPSSFKRSIESHAIRKIRSLPSFDDVLNDLVEESSGGDDIINTIENVKFLVKNTDPTTSAQMNLRDVIPGDAILTSLVLNNEGYTYELSHEIHREKSEVLREFNEAVAGGYSSVLIGDVQPSETLCEGCRYVYEGQQVNALINVAPNDVFSVSLSFAVPIGDNFTDVHVVIELFEPATNIEGVIFSPNYPNPYPDNAEVTWNIELPSNNLMINATILGFETEAYYDVLTVYDGPTNSDPVLIETSGYPDVGNSILSTGPDMLIEFISDGSVPGNGFALKYASQMKPETPTTTLPDLGTTTPSLPSTSSCFPAYLNNTDCDISKTTVKEQYTIEADSGSLLSPGYPMGYSPESEVTWNIDFSGSVIIFQIIDVDLYSGDYVSITSSSNGHTQTVLASAVEDNNLIAVMKTSDVIVTFYSLNSATHGIRKPRGFYASYQSYIPNQLYLEEYVYSWKIISSPNYPSYYDNKEDMVWTITAPEMYIVEIEITDLNLEDFHDFLYIYQVNTTHYSELMAKLSGTTGKGYTLYTKENVALINFVSDYTTSGRGFQLGYKLASHYCSQLLVNIDAPYGIFRNPDFPDYTSSNRSCQMLFSVDSSKVIKFWVEDFDSYYNSVVSFYDGSVPGSSLISSFYDVSNYNFMSTVNQVFTVVQRSTHDYDRRFYMMTFTAVDKDEAFCTNQQVLTDSRGIITSPSYPGKYPQISDCQWLIQLELSSRVVIEFEYFSVSSGDILTFYDGGTINDNVLLSCGSCNSAMYLLATGNQVLVRFTSQNTNYGFKLYYYDQSSMCDDQLVVVTEDSGIVMSPNYPSNYPNNVNCEYSFSVSPGNVIYYYFVYFYTYNSNDRLVIYDGPSTASTTLATVWGSNSGYLGASSGNEITMIFTTDAGGQRQGFYMTYSTQIDSMLPPDHAYSYLFIGREYTGTKRAVIFSPGFPNPYPNDVDMVWYVQGESSTYRIYFFYSHLEIDRYDFLAFYSGFGTDPRNLARVVYSNHYHSVVSIYVSRPSATVWFHSGPANNGQGFYLEYYCTY